MYALVYNNNCIILIVNNVILPNTIVIVFKISSIIIMNGKSALSAFLF